MPLYDYTCTYCSYEGEHITKMDDTTPSCPECHMKMKRLFHSTFGINMGVGAYGYYDENLDTYIHTNKQKKEVMREQGVTEKIGKGWY